MHTCVHNVKDVMKTQGEVLIRQHEITKTESDESCQREMSAGEVSLGQWVWVMPESAGESEDGGDGDDDDESALAAGWFGCVMRVGSNFIYVEEPNTRDVSGRRVRIHYKDCPVRLRVETNPNDVIAKNISHHQKQAKLWMSTIADECSKLGLRSSQLSAVDVPPPAKNALIVLHSTPDVNAYKAELTLAKDVTLPTLFRNVKEAHANLALWLHAQTMPAIAAMGSMENVISDVNDRILNIGLYAGLTEAAKLCGAKGEPAGLTDKLHVLQRMLYMDEECLINYAAGGMDFQNIEEFDKWLATPENRDQILPYPRTLVAMRVRRLRKERQAQSIAQAFVNIGLENADKLTYLYIRNGEQVWRIECEIDFGEMLFPDSNFFNPDEPKMALIYSNKVEGMITAADYELRQGAYEKEKRAFELWSRKNPKKDSWYNPHRDYERVWYAGLSYCGSFGKWTPFNESSVYYDECLASIEKKIAEYNRTATIIQGLFDRSEVLHPHAPVRSWTPAGFEAAITLVYDASRAIYGGAKPDFEAYRAACNAKANENSVFVGQDFFWTKKEADKENAILDRSHRTRDSDYRHVTYRPYNNPGPGLYAKPSKFKAKSAKVNFSWERKRRDWRSTRRDGLTSNLTVPLAELFNVSAYSAGDYKRFLSDSRTRQEYLQWAPLLLAAEDYVHGKVKPEDAIE